MQRAKSRPSLILKASSKRGEDRIILDVAICRMFSRRLLPRITSFKPDFLKCPLMVDSLVYSTAGVARLLSRSPLMQVQL